VDYSDPYPADSEQFMLIEELYKQTDKLQIRVDSMLHNEVNIAALAKSVDKLQSDVEKLTTNAKGQASFTPSAQDVYLMQVRLRTDAPEGADVPTYSYTTTLSFEAY